MEAAARTFPLVGTDTGLNSAVARTALSTTHARETTHGSPPAPGFDKSEFSELIAQNQLMVYGYLRARLLEPADADDLCQEVFLRCYQGRQSAPRSAEIGFWLVGIARNVLREYARRIKRRREVAWTELCLELDSLVTNESLAEHEALTHLPTCLDSLGKSARDGLEMQYFSKFKLYEIGERLKRSEGAVKLLLFRARQALKNCLDAKMQDPR